MEIKNDYNSCVSFMRSQLTPASEAGKETQKKCVKPVITITRQTGSGGHLLANKLAEYLHKNTPKECAWAVFDQNLVEKVLEEHNLPKEISKYMPEAKRSILNDMVEEALGLHPPSWELIRQTTETILGLAQSGNVIIVGRAANVITRNMPNTFHVRLIGSFERRVERIMQMGNLTRKEAENHLKTEDTEQVRYLKHYFETIPNDPLLYHLIVNTDLIEPEEAATIIGDIVIKRFNLNKTYSSDESIMETVVP